MFNSILFAIFVSFVCGFETGEIVNGNDTIFWYPYFQDECIDECGSNGTCISLQGYMRYCSSKAGYTWSNKICTGTCEPFTYGVSNSSTNHVTYGLSNSSTNHVPTGYYSCTTETTTRGQTWDYCSLHKKRSKVHLTIHERRCKSSCQKILSPSKYNNQSVCSIGFSGSKVLYEECSENHQVTYKGEKCLSACKRAPKVNSLEDRYNCDTGYFSSDYCGLVFYLPLYE